MRVVGLDLSVTQTGIARADWVKVLKTPAHKVSGPARLILIREQLANLVYGCDVVFLEGYSFGSKGNAVFQTGELGGIVRVMLCEMSIPYVEVPPSTLKTYATGKGNANKVEVLVAARDRLGYTGTNDNEADALWLRALGMAAYGHSQLNLPKTHMRALAKLELPDITIQETI